MSKEFNTTATFTKGARVVSDYKNDMIFEQPRAGLVQQEFVSYENVDIGTKRTTITRKFTTNGGYDDIESITILPRN
tara:strand:+ start:989 stop:1219 length:231 start_codon:yes stop_codon:yes gene_type:complete